MEIIENKLGVTVGHEITKRINSNTTLSVSTGIFSIYAFYLLKEELKNIEGLKVLLLADPFTQSPNGVSVLLYDSLRGGSEESEIKRKLLLRYASEECSRILQKSKIKALSTPFSFGFKLIFVENNNESCVINQGMYDFNSISLGFIKSDIPQHHILQRGKDDVAKLKTLFDNIWSDSSKTNNITEIILTELKKGYRDYSPEEVYYFILHHLFHNSIADFSNENIFKSKTGFKDKDIWKMLYNFQKDGVMGAIEKIERYGGCIIADSVGLGKTFEALAVEY